LGEETEDVTWYYMWQKAVKCYNYTEPGHRPGDCPKERR
jgi:hypothetical protein